MLPTLNSSRILVLSFTYLTLNAAGCAKLPLAANPAGEAGAQQVLQEVLRADLLSRRNSSGESTTSIRSLEEAKYVTGPANQAARVHTPEVDLGIIRLSGDDARRLYEALGVKERTLRGTAADRVSTNRIGRNLECYAEKDLAAKTETYSCNLFFDPATGEAKVRNENARQQARPKPDFAHYAGFNANIRADLNLAFIEVINEEAKVIADALKVKPGRDIRCHANSRVQTCLVEIDLADGSAHAASNARF